MPAAVEMDTIIAVSSSPSSPTSGCQVHLSNLDTQWPKTCINVKISVPGNSAEQGQWDVGLHGGKMGWDAYIRAALSVSLILRSWVRHSCTSIRSPPDLLPVHPGKLLPHDIRFSTSLPQSHGLRHYPTRLRTFFFCRSDRRITHCHDGRQRHYKSHHRTTRSCTIPPTRHERSTRSTCSRFRAQTWAEKRWHGSICIRPL